MKDAEKNAEDAKRDAEKDAEDGRRFQNVRRKCYSRDKGEREK